MNYTTEHHKTDADALKFRRDMHDCSNIKRICLYCKATFIPEHINYYLCSDECKLNYYDLKL